MTDTTYDPFTYDCYVVGRATRTVDAPTADGTDTIEEGSIRLEPRCEDELALVRAEDGWTSHLLDPDADDPVLAGAHVPHDLLGVLWFPEPMTDHEAADWLETNPERWREFRTEHLDTEIASDTTAADLLDGGVR
ncbi:hypothetical protein NDI85_19955 [Halomicroarcula sp. S1AR25-4]|uniref:hypothetical protein n=1 Tax=Haloarcula sp. S1AR25-4 TaxID=2950538 RepID=UPI0028744DA3|nr:hypothetical protein [Halomicroarcula sp. S1AR25-4]MDS0280063.1 hypothetical protein [Halomicroarcula sp. S1AR25-4]